MKNQNKETADMEQRRMEARIAREKACIDKRILYNNKWKVGSVWKDDARVMLDKYLVKNTLWSSIPLNENALIFFNNDPTIDKLFALFLDSFDAMPYHPDFAFDIIWRVYEASLVNYGRNWRPCPDGTHVLITKASNDIVDSLANHEALLKDLIEDYLCNIPLSLLRFMFARMYYERELGVSEQLTLIQTRCKAVLGEMYELIKEKYNVGQGVVTAADQRNAAILLGKIFRGEDIVLGNPQTTFKALTLKHRVELLINGIIFTSRCERFHGDVPSPFKSSLNTSLSRYQTYYYLAASTTLFYYCVLFKEAANSGIEIFSIQDLSRVLEEIREQISNMYHD